MESYVEHANISVSDLDREIEFLICALPDFKVRKRFTIDGRNWAHIGTDRSYLALVEAADSNKGDVYPDGRRVNMDAVGFNHVGFVVDDVEAVGERLRLKGFAGGFNGGQVIHSPYRRSAYFLDPDGNEFEFMEYLTDDVEQRNFYDV